MAEEIDNSLADTHVPDVCPLCLDRRKQFEKDGAHGAEDYRVGHIHGGKCSRCGYRAGAAGSQTTPTNTNNRNSP